MTDDILDADNRLPCPAQCGHSVRAGDKSFRDLKKAGIGLANHIVVEHDDLLMAAYALLAVEVAHTNEGSGRATSLLATMSVIQEISRSGETQIALLMEGDMP